MSQDSPANLSRQLDTSSPAELGRVAVSQGSLLQVGGVPTMRWLLRHSYDDSAAM